MAQLAYEESDDIDRTIDAAEQALFGVSQRRVSRDMVPISEAIRQYFDRIEYLYEHRGEPLGIPTGFLDLDKMLGGLQRSDLLIIAARPGVGKTSLMLNMALERRAAIPSARGDLLAGNVHRADRAAPGQRGDRHRQPAPAAGRSARRRMGPVRAGHQRARAMRRSTWTTRPASAPCSLRTKARRLHAEFGLDLIIIDYLQLMTGDNRTENRVQEISYLSRSLKGLARELNVPVLVASQLSRAVEQRSDKRPVLSDLRESGSIEQDADIVMFIYRDDVYDEVSDRKNVAELIIAKHRNGPTGTVELYFQRNLTQFRNALKRDVALEC